MPSVWVTRFGDYLKNVLSLKESTETTVIGDLLPVLPVLNPAREELATLWGDRRYATRLSVGGGGAGTFTTLEVENPAGSGRLVVVDYLDFVQQTAGYLTAYVDNAGAGVGVAGPQRRDSRLESDTGSCVRIYTVAAGAAASVYIPRTYNGSATQPAALSASCLPLVIGPGRSAMFKSDRVNEAAIFNLAWRERDALPAELARFA